MLPAQLPRQHPAAQLLGQPPASTLVLRVFLSTVWATSKGGIQLHLHSTPTDEETPSPLCPTFTISSNGDIIIFYITIFTGNHFLPKLATGKSALLQPTCTSWNKRVYVSTPTTICHASSKSTFSSLLKKGCWPLWTMMSC